MQENPKEFITIFHLCLNLIFRAFVSTKSKVTRQIILVSSKPYFPIYSHFIKKMVKPMTDFNVGQIRFWHFE